MTDTHPLPCPYCGGDKTFLDTLGYLDAPGTIYSVTCANPDCGAEGPAAFTQAGALEKWNTRPGEAAMNTETERLREALTVIGRRTYGGARCVNTNDAIELIEEVNARARVALKEREP